MVPSSSVRKRSSRRALCAALAVVCVVGMAAPPPLVGQVDVSVRARNAALNGAVGAATVAVRRLVTGKPSGRAVAQGAVGGVVMGLGKQVAGGGAPASGVLGRSVHAVGISITAAAATDEPQLLLPLGPLTLHVPLEAGRRVHARLDAADLAVLLQTAFAPESRFDAAASLSAGAPVFVRPQARMRDPAVRGYARLGTIVLSDMPHSDYPRETLLAHETIHVLQLDALRLLAGHPAERAVMRRVPALRGISRYVDVGIAAPAVISALHVGVTRERHPLEREAYLLTIGSVPGDGGGSGRVLLGSGATP